MNKHTFFLFLAIIITSCSNAQRNSDIPLPSGKSIYIPKELQGMDLQNPASQWSYHRMAYTENFVIFWEKGFGNDLSNPPQLEGHSMKVDLPGNPGRDKEYDRGEAGKLLRLFLPHAAVCQARFEM